MLELHLVDRVLRFEGRPLVMGVVNVTPDSFSDGGAFLAPDAAVAHGLELVRQGADLLDIGGESSRPGAAPVSAEEELRRVLPVVEALARRTAVPLSIDTYKAEVARAALAAGAHIVNDITALRGDPEMAGVVRQYRAGLILMHMQGTPATMQLNPQYDDVVRDICRFLQERLQAAADLGIAKEQVVLDPGIGFGKTLTHNLQILARLEEFQRLGRPVCLGVSRKGFLGQITGRPVDRRLAGSLAAVCYALAKRAVQMVRVHDVEETVDAVKVFQAVDEVGKETGA
ncbi:MAG TPA: dihydropteroate synthase [Gemmataceae bacterium]|nr:dihydropteroate synthase [Gemmataceae bacterium]